MIWQGEQLTMKQLNFPSRYLQDFQQIHSLNRFTKHSEAKNFSGTKFYAMTSSFLMKMYKKYINKYGGVFRGGVLLVPFNTHEFL